MEHFRLESQLAQETQALLSPEHIGATPTYPLIHMIRTDIMHFIDTPIAYEALIAPELTYTLIRPLHEKYQQLQHPPDGKGNMAIPFCLLVNLVHFQRDTNLSTSAVSKTRAHLCEILAIRLTRDFGNNMLHLSLALTTSWNIFSGADSDVLSYAKEEYGDDIDDKIGNTIEIAIIGKARRFIKSSSCQKVIDGIWTGRCTYKQTPIHFYDPHKAPLLDHYRLKVPAIRSVLEYWNFVLLFLLFIVAIETVERDRLVPTEVIFMVYALGFTLEKVAAMQEHGIQVYFNGTWNGFDLAFITVYALYIVLRLYGYFWDHFWSKKFGIDCMALIACLLFPRLAFVTLRDNLMVLALRAMLVQFVVLMAIAAFCFGGFLYALWTLSRGNLDAGIIAWWMLDLWFGLDAAGFQNSQSFHPIFGPILMVTYASLSNTLLLTVLVSILSNTFATINEDAAAEAMFRKAVSTIEGVKADSLFSYQPPVNLLALLVMLPSSYVLSPRWFHKVNVFLIRLLNFPILLAISIYERTAKHYSTNGAYETIWAVLEDIWDRLPRSIKRMVTFDALLSSEAEIDLLFEIEEEVGSALVVDEDEMSPFRYDPPPNQRNKPDENGSIPSPDRPGRERRRNASPLSPPRLASRSRSRARTASPRRPVAPAARAPSPARQRTRLPSMQGNALQNFTSPLAQIYQPLVVATEHMLEDFRPQTSEASTSPTGSPLRERRVSQGVTQLPIPQIRARRISANVIGRTPSMGHASSSNAATSGIGSGGLKHHFPSISEDHGVGGFMSESPDAISLGRGSPGLRVPGPGVSTAEGGDSAAAMQDTIAQLKERQKRMEDLLTEVLKEVKALKG
ncbi:hypothetical protein DL96DRAFT_1705027 [Flagelloscypha sp. PMI_526]|nr:hypothetical protein DL96DRAFT_1705027 [Flagelloscypha sp. PMI_526]